MNPFAPRGYLETFNSLNRVWMPQDRCQAVQLLSSDAVIALIEEADLSEGLEERYPRRSFPKGLAETAFGDCPSEERQKAARNLIDRYAYRVARFLECLLTGPPASRENRSGWLDEHWDWWKGVKTVVLAGGLSLGYYGYAIAKACTSFFKESRRSLILPTRRHLLPSAGAACLVPLEGDGLVAAFDFGHSAVKRHVYQRIDGVLTDYTALPNLETPRNFDMRDGRWDADSEALREFFFGVLGDSITDISRRWEKPLGIGVSLANYVQDGRVVSRGLFGNLAKDGDDGANLTTDFKELCRSLAMDEKAWSLRHDGTAAAAPFALRRERTAVILLGSAIGGGFPLDRPVSTLGIDGVLNES